MLICQSNNLAVVFVPDLAVISILKFFLDKIIVVVIIIVVVAPIINPFQKGGS